MSIGNNITGSYSTCMSMWLTENAKEILSLKLIILVI